MRQMSDHLLSSVAANYEIHFLSLSCNRPKMHNFEQQQQEINIILYMYAGMNSVIRNKEGKIIGICIHNPALI